MIFETPCLIEFIKKTAIFLYTDRIDLIYIYIYLGPSGLRA